MRAVERPSTPGLIPAHAGKTGSQPQVSVPPSAHPRSRGENLAWAVEGARGYGSSPLTRGKLPGENDPRTRAGLIPAHAGKTSRSQGRCDQIAAHPRSRGENKPKNDAGIQGAGSSPLTRGKRFGVGAGLRIVRLIPAHAGKTRRDAGRAVSNWAHPRSRGENELCSASHLAAWGSSPLTRGKPRRGNRPRARRRLIPAHAGKTPRGAVPDRLCKAHPRSRGENVLVNEACQLTTRLIPAHAGKTPGPVWKRWVPSAHPRSRGENMVRLGSYADSLGSSPLTRGKPQLAYTLD